MRTFTFKSCEQLSAEGPQTARVLEPTGTGTGFSTHTLTLRPVMVPWPAVLERPIEKITYVQAITSTTDRVSSMIYRHRHFKSSHTFHISTDDVINFRHIAFGTNSSMYREIL